MAELGYKVSGSDMRANEVCDKLRGMGIDVSIGHRAENVNGADVVIASAAIKSDNPELAFAESKSIPVLSRAQLLGRMMASNHGIAVAGTHGKTTTTSMLAVVLEVAGLDPTIVIGGELDLIGGSAKLGKSDLFLAEACEAFRSFYEFIPETAVVTNIEADHLDCYGTLDGVMEGFSHFLSQIKPGGSAVMCIDNANVRKVIPSLREKVVTYGFSEDAEWRGYDVDIHAPQPVFGVIHNGEDLGTFTLHVPGRHNVLNALAVLAVGAGLNIDFDVMREALLKFNGAGRRFEILGTAKGITVIDDYAHHPTEVKATLKAAHAHGRRVVAVFQPHLFSRTQEMADGFAESLKIADEVYLAEIYPARELPIPGVSSAMIADRMKGAGFDPVHFYPEKKKLEEALLSSLVDGDLLVVMGAGDIRTVAEVALAELRASN
jgi:UDP-N-acetylmuramate--alanine ligase